MYEVEIKSQTPAVDAVTQRLTELHATRLQTIRQSDEYFNHPARDFQQTDEALRIRCVNDRAVVTYKGPRVDGETKTRREIEFPLGEGATPDCRQCLIELGFRPVAVVRKTRRLWRLHFQGREFEVAQDSVDELGEFTEVETSADEATLEDATRIARELAQTLGLGPSIRTSYLELLLESQAET